eukprot:GFUD01092755.1.p1 GENE.GFUD01092755.1~~GFUD01092755.1.p1  ORF type:complete len:147 (+),score=64.70 GFUD01092755.1:53-442(+)
MEVEENTDKKGSGTTVLSTTSSISPMMEKKDTIVQPKKKALPPSPQVVPRHRQWTTESSNSGPVQKIELGGSSDKESLDRTLPSTISDLPFTKEKDRVVQQKKKPPPPTPPTSSQTPRPSPTPTPSPTP